MWGLGRTDPAFCSNGSLHSCLGRVRCPLQTGWHRALHAHDGELALLGRSISGLSEALKRQKACPELMFHSTMSPLQDAVTRSLLLRWSIHKMSSEWYDFQCLHSITLPSSFVSLGRGIKQAHHSCAKPQRGEEGEEEGQPSPHSSPSLSL